MINYWLSETTRRILRHAPNLLNRRSTHTATLDNFDLFPNFFALREQSILLTAALQKLNAGDTVKDRRRRNKSGIVIPALESDSAYSIDDFFYPDEYYKFEEDHLDGVIRNYRETHVSSWPDVAGLSPILDRLSAICPSKNTQTHLLHLSTRGEILPHVDNLEASGSWILGVSLGCERILRLHPTDAKEETHEISLPSGSVYLQRDNIRYKYKHSILLPAAKEKQGQRVSLMLRDLPPS